MMVPPHFAIGQSPPTAKYPVAIWNPVGSQAFYLVALATTIRAISGLSLQTPSARMTKSAGSKT